MSKPLYPNLCAEMARKGESAEDLAKLLNVAGLTVYNKLNGNTDFKLSEINAICKHYDSDYYTLFVKGE